jgi:hypothetical protein
MGALRRGGRAAVAALLLAAGARAAGSSQVEPIARLSLEGGYDSNVMYNGQGGQGMGVVSPDLGLRVRDRTWDMRLQGGGDLLLYQQRSGDPVWNQRGRFALRARPAERLTVETNLAATYAADPIGLARLGIFGAGGSALIGHGTARVGWRIESRWRVAATFNEDLVRFQGGTGAASHVPGVEVIHAVTERLELGGAYRFDFFQGLGPGAQNARAHEAQALLRYRWTRRLTLEAQAGPALWTGPGGDTALLPQATVQLLANWRGGDARASLRHGVGLGLLATPGLFDAVEAGVTTRLGRYFQLHADGGVWRSGAIPWGANAVIGYGVEGSFDWRAGGGVLIGISGSRFARLDVSVPQYDRNILGLHVAWELEHRRGEP